MAWSGKVRENDKKMKKSGNFVHGQVDLLSVTVTVHTRCKVLCPVVQILIELDFLHTTFSTHHWVENAVVIQCMLDILPDMKQYVKAADEKHLKSRGTKSFEVIKPCCSSAVRACDPVCCKTFAAIFLNLSY